MVSDGAVIERFLDVHRGIPWGLVVYVGDEVVPLSRRVLAVPLDRLL